MKKNEPPRARRMGRAAAALLLSAAAIVPAVLTAPAAAATVEPGDAVWVGPGVGYPGTSIHPVYSPVPADTANPGTPDMWSYCIEHDISARPDAVAVVGDYSSYLGSNYFTDPVIQAKVHWVITHAYPAVSLADLAVAAGATGLTANDAIEGAQYAVWRYTDLTFDANWAFETPASAAVYWYLVNGANADTATAPPATTEVEVSVSGPAASGAAGSLVGPFTVSTNQPTVALSSNPMHAFTDAAGSAIDPAAVVNGQQVYLDLRDSTAAGSATVTATANGASGTGLVISTPEEGSTTATPGSHRQSLILVTAENATTAASATGTWVVAAAPSIGTTLVDAADEDHTLAWNGGSLVDTIAYSGLTVGQEYTVAGELMVQSDGSATGITGSTTFTPTAADGTVDVTFAVPTGYAGEALVAFETLYSGGTATGTPVAEHTDIEDVNQTVTVEEVPLVPTIGTTLLDAADEDHVLTWNGGSLVDTIAYSGLTVGQEYTVAGELMVQSDGSATGITGQTTFTPTASDGTVDVTFAVPTGYAGEALVAFETLYEGDTATGTPVAEHTDIDDVNQTVTVEQQPLVPTIATTLLDSADQDHTLAWNGGTVVDTIAYTGLTPGVEYTVSGELMRKSDGSSTGITATATFTPTSASGSVAVKFTVPSGFAGESLVAFETLYTGATASGTPVAEHTDINDAAQTVTVEKQPAGTGLAITGGALPVGLTAVAVTAILLGVMFMIARRRATGEV